jgi:hypothetical protein
MMMMMMIMNHLNHKEKRSHCNKRLSQVMVVMVAAMAMNTINNTVKIRSKNNCSMYKASRYIMRVQRETPKATTQSRMRTTIVNTPL